jgi:hypothetical protein
VAGDLENEVGERVTEMRRDERRQLLGRRNLGIAIAERRELQTNEPVICTLDQVRRHGRGEKNACNDAASFARIVFVVGM